MSRTFRVVLLLLVVLSTLFIGNSRGAIVDYEKSDLNSSTAPVFSALVARPVVSMSAYTSEKVYKAAADPDSGNRLITGFLFGNPQQPCWVRPVESQRISLGTNRISIAIRLINRSNHPLNLQDDKDRLITTLSFSKSPQFSSPPGFTLLL